MAREAGPQNLTVLVTGASTGIGRASALALDRAGFRVLAGVRRQADGEMIKHEATERLDYVILDVTDTDSINQASARVAAEVGEQGLYGLMNNAGIVVAGPLELVPIERFEAQMRVNVTGLVAVTQALLPLIRRARGRIVITGSESGRNSLPLFGPYCASKHAVEAIADALRIELRKFGVSVSILEPGSVDTGLWEKTRQGSQEDAGVKTDAVRLYRRDLNALAKLTRMQSRMSIPPEKVARVALRAFTCRRSRARYVVGVDARLIILGNRLTPTALKDWALAKAIRRYGRE